MHAIPDSLCYLNGQFGALRDAKVSVLDRGFLFGDAIYEVLPVYGRRIFRFEEHIARLQRNLAKVRIASPLASADWLALCRRLVEAHGADDQLLYLQVTRGVAPREHTMPGDVEPTVFIMTDTLRAPSTEQRHQGVACITARDTRPDRDTELNSTCLLGNVMARQISADHGAVETILFRDGFLTDASGSNVWIASEGALLGAPKGEHAGDGVRHELLRELCEETGTAFNLRPLSEAEVLAADEVMLSGTGIELLAVTRVDGEPVGHGALRGKPGPVYGRLYEAFQAAKREQSI